MDTKIYCGNGRVVETKFGNMMKLSLTEEDVKRLQENLKDGWVNIDVKKRKEPSKGGTTHYLEVNTFQKEEKKEEPSSSPF